VTAGTYNNFNAVRNEVEQRIQNIILNKDEGPELGKWQRTKKDKSLCDHMHGEWIKLIASIFYLPPLF
jgi:hypothetical protein